MALFGAVEALAEAVGTAGFGAAFGRLLNLVSARPAVEVAIRRHLPALVELLH